MRDMSSHAPPMPWTPTVSVALAASHQGVREGLRSLLAREAGLRLDAVVADARSAARCVLARHPDVLMIALPGALRDDGALVRRLRALAPRTAIVLATTASGKAYRSVADDAGAAALVALDGPAEDLLGAIRAAAPRSWNPQPSPGRTLPDS